MKRIRHVHCTVLAVGVGLLALLASPQTGTAQSQNVVGQATALQATVVGLLGTTTTQIAGTGGLAGYTDARSASEPTGAIAGIGGAEVLVATTISSVSTWAAQDAVASSASLANLALTLAGIQISADFVMSQAQATVGGITTGAFSVEGLKANGIAVPVTGAPNQTVSLPGLRLVINEVARSAGGIAVTALHITAVGGAADVIVASATAGVQ